MYIVSPPADLVGAYHGGRQPTTCLISEFPQQRKTMLEVIDNVNFKLTYISQWMIIFFIQISLSICYDCVHYFHHMWSTLVSTYQSWEASTNVDGISGKQTGLNVCRNWAFYSSDSSEQHINRGVIPTLQRRCNESCSVLTLPSPEDLDQDASRAWMKNVRFCLTSLRKLVTEVADYLIESLDAARWRRWEETTEQMNFAVKLQELVTHPASWSRSKPTKNKPSSGESWRHH